MKRDGIYILLLVFVVICAGTAGKILIKQAVRKTAHASAASIFTSGDDFVDDAMNLAADKIASGTVSFADDEIVEDTVNLSKFEKLELDVASIDTYIEPGDELKLEYRVYGYNVPIVAERNGILNIKQPTHIGIMSFHISGQNQYYKLTVPKDAGILNVYLSATSGTISVKDLDIQGDVELTSGEFKLKNSKGDKLSIIMTSGNAKIENVAYNKINMDVTSGSVDLELVGNEDDYSFDLDATSGDFEVGDRKIKDHYRCGDDKDKMIKADLTSGDIDISFTE